MSEFYAYTDDELRDDEKDLDRKINETKCKINKHMSMVNKLEANYYQLLCLKHPVVYVIAYGGFPRRHVGYFSTREKAAHYLPYDFDQFKFSIEEIESTPDNISKLDLKPKMIFQYEDIY
jgi:hypothetical protein